MNAADINDTILDAIMDAGFLPVDVVEDDPTNADLGWVGHYGWDVFMPLDSDTARPSHERHVAVARWSEDGIALTVSARNYVIEAEATFSFTASGAAMFIAALGGLPVQPPVESTEGVEVTS